MEASNIINGLKHLSEGLFLPEEWIDWWEQNEKFAKQFLSSRWYLKIVIEVKRLCFRWSEGVIVIKQRNNRGETEVKCG